MRQFLIAAVTCSLLGSGPALAQVGMITGAPAPLGVTSPLGLGPGAPIGATESRSAPRSSQRPASARPPVGTAALGSMTASTACSGVGASAQPTTSIPGTSGMVTTSAPNAMTTTDAMMSGTPAPTPLFEFHGHIGECVGTCAERHRDGDVQCNGLGLLADRPRRAIDRRPRRDPLRFDRTFAGRPQSAARHHRAEPALDGHNGYEHVPVRAQRLIADHGSIGVFRRLLKAANSGINGRDKRRCDQN